MFQLHYSGGTSRQGVPQLDRHSMQLIMERFSSGGRPSPRFADSIGSKTLKTRRSDSLRSPRLNAA